MSGALELRLGYNRFTQTDSSELVVSLPKTETSFTQIGPGNAQFLSARLCGRDVALRRLRFAPEMVGHVVPHQDWLALLAPISWEGDYKFNGIEALPGDIFLSSCHDGYFTSGRSRDTISIGLRRSAFISTLAALSGLPADEIYVEDKVFRGSSINTGRLSALLPTLFTWQSREALADESAILEHDLEAFLVYLVACCFLDRAADRFIHRSPFTDPKRIVRAAEELIAERSGQVITLAELCSASSVGHTRLHEAFLEVCGISPMRYLKYIRLSEVHARLTNTEARPLSVKDAAISAGFLNSGRFAREYRLLFDELPSETLKR